MNNSEHSGLCVSPVASRALDVAPGQGVVPLCTDLTIALQAIVREHLNHLVPNAATLQDVFDQALRRLETTVRPSGRGVALLADNEYGLLMCFGVFLEANGYDVVCASDEAEALNHLQSGQPFDILVSDEAVLDGEPAEFLARVRELRPAMQTLLLSDLRDATTADAESADLDAADVPTAVNDPYPPNVVALRDSVQWRARFPVASGTVAA